MKMKVCPFLRALFLCLVMIWMMGISTTVWAGESYVYGYFHYTVADDSVTITGYTGDEEVVKIPSMIAGNPVNTIASGAFAGAENTATIYLPDTIMTVESGAFSAVQSVVFSGGNAADTVPLQEDKENGTNSTGSASNQEGSGADNDSNVPDEGGSKTDEEAQEDGTIRGIRDGKGNLITTDDEGNLIRVDTEGNESVLDDTQRYTIEEGKDGQPGIMNEKGDPVTVENGERISFVDGNRDQVTVDPDGSKTVRNEEGKYSYEEVELGDSFEEEAAAGSVAEAGPTSEAISGTEGDTSREETISIDASVSAEGQSESDSRQGTGGTLPVVILCVAFIAIAVFLIMRRKKHDH